MESDFVAAVAILSFGAIVGSFLNVVILRLQTGHTFVGGRSHCMSCGKTLSWWELVPVVSYLLLRGRCSSCRSGVSAQYPLIEAATALLFFLAYKAATPFPTPDAGLSVALWWTATALLLVIACYDYRHRIIPAGPLWSLYALALLSIVLTASGGTLGFVLILGGRLISGALLALPFYALWQISDGRWIGLGDSKLALAMGLLLGLRDGLSALLLSIYIAAAWAVSLMVTSRLLQKRSGALTLKSEVPFGPFLAIGTIVLGLVELGALYLVPFIPLYHFSL